MLKHVGLNATLQGVTRQFDSLEIQQYRCIQYGRISGRFAKPEPVEIPTQEQKLDCTQWGPRCPQIPVDASDLLRVPKEHDLEQKAKLDYITLEDELACLNLSVTLPTGAKNAAVLVWIHGGSQSVTFGYAGQPCGDPRRLVAESAKYGTPVIVVAVQFRLNIFAFGDGDPKGSVNLALEDQKLALDWVKQHIRGFGGNEENITLAGESAGAVHVHAHTIIGTLAKRAIIMSGTLSLSPPVPRGGPIPDKVLRAIKEIEGPEASLKSARPETLIQALDKLGIISIPLQQTPELQGWAERTEKVESLMIGDLEYESVIWRNGIETMTAPEIHAAFSLVQNEQQRAWLMSLYGVEKDRPTASKLGALDFINDVAFAMPCDSITRRRRRDEDKPTYRYICDQVNPWQWSARAHHALDLIFLFGGYDISFDPVAETVGSEFRRRFIRFIAGSEPWRRHNVMSFGPAGICRELSDRAEIASRRRERHFDVLRGIDRQDIIKVLIAFVAGKASFNN